MIKTYDTYKDSGIAWIGNIPSGWTTIKNKYLYKFLYSGGTPTASEGLFYSDEGCPFVSISDMSTNEYVTETKKHLTKAGLADKKLKVLQKGTILYSIYATVGAVSELKIDASISQAMLAIRLKDSINKEYYKYNLKTMKEYIYSQANGNTQVNLNADKVSNFNICYPSISEQQTIASFLDKKCGEIEELLAVQEQMISELQAYKQSIITEVVTKGLNPNTKMKDSGIEWIGEFPKAWSIQFLSKIIWLRARLGWKGLKAEEYVEKGYPFLSAFNIVNNKLQWDDLNYINQERYEESPEIKLSVGDVLIVKDGAGIGKTARIDSLPLGEATVNSSLGVITPSDKLYYKYLYYFLLSNSFQNIIGFIRNGMGVPHLTQENMKSVQITVPPINEQQEIAAYLDEKTAQIDSLIALKQEKIAELKDYKKSIIYEYVTGKKKV